MSTDDSLKDVSSEEFSPGESLRKAREQQGVAISEVAETLKITETYVRALESNDFDELPQSAFVRGYIRNYARLLNLDCEAHVLGYDRFTGNKGAEATQLKNGQQDQVKLGAHAPPHKGLIGALLAVIVVGGLTYYGWNTYQATNPEGSLALLGERIDASVSPGVEEPGVVTENSVPTEYLMQPDEEEDTSRPVVDGAEDIDAASIEEPVIEPDVSGEPVISGVTPEDQDQAALDIDITSSVPILSNAEPSEVQKLPGQVSLSVAFSADCWIEIKDANGVTVLSDLRRAGSSLELNVTAPVRVRLGNAPGVSNMTFDGIPVVVLPPGSTKRVASLVLEVAEQG